MNPEEVCARGVVCHAHNSISTHNTLVSRCIVASCRTTAERNQQWRRHGREGEGLSGLYPPDVGLAPLKLEHTHARTQPSDDGGSFFSDCGHFPVPSSLPFFYLPSHLFSSPFDCLHLPSPLLPSLLSFLTPPFLIPTFLFPLLSSPRPAPPPPTFSSISSSFYQTGDGWIIRLRTSIMIGCVLTKLQGFENLITIEALSKEVREQRSQLSGTYSGSRKAKRIKLVH